MYSLNFRWMHIFSASIAFDKLYRRGSGGGAGDCFPIDCAHLIPGKASFRAMSAFHFPWVNYPSPQRPLPPSHRAGLASDPQIFRIHILNLISGI